MLHIAGTRGAKQHRSALRVPTMPVLLARTNLITMTMSVLAYAPALWDRPNSYDGYSLIVTG